MNQDNAIIDAAILIITPMLGSLQYSNMIDDFHIRVLSKETVDFKLVPPLVRITWELDIKEKSYGWISEPFDFSQSGIVDAIMGAIPLLENTLEYNHRVKARYENALNDAFDDAVKTQDNALKRALIPVLKAATKAINTYVSWAAKHLRLSNIIIGVVLVVIIASVIMVFLTPLGMMCLTVFFVGALIFALAEVIHV